MSTDPKPEVRFVEGGVVSAEAYPMAGEPDLRAENERLRAENLELREALWGVYQNRMTDDGGRCEPPCGECSQCLARASLAAGNGPPFNDRASGATPAATESRGRILTPPGVAAETELSAHHAGSVFAVSPEFAKKFPALTPCGGCDDPTCRQHWRAP